MDIDAWIQTISSKLNKKDPTKKTKISVHYKAPAAATGTLVNHKPSQDEIDFILDKISASGYESLSPFEKEILFKASEEDVE